MFIRAFSTPVFYRIQHSICEQWHVAWAAWSTMEAAKALDVRATFSDRQVLLIQQAIEAGWQAGVTRKAFSDTVAYAYLIMSSTQREFFEFSRWYMNELEGQVWGGARNNPITVTDSDDDCELADFEDVMEEV